MTAISATAVLVAACSGSTNQSGGGSTSSPPGTPASSSGGSGAAASSNGPATSGSANAAPGSGNLPTAASAAPTGSAITLGELGPLTASRADIGAAMVTGSKLALGIINAHGGVLGHKVNLDPQDTASDPADAVPAADKEISSDHAVAIVGPIIQTAPVVLPLAAKANIPMVMWGGGAAFDSETSPYFFRLAPSDTEMAYAMIQYANKKGYKRIALAIGNTTGDTSLVAPLQDAATKLGMTITNKVTIAVGSTSFRSEITNLFSGNPQAIVGQFDIPSAGVLFGELKQENKLSTPWVVSNLWFAKEFFDSVGKDVAAGPIYIANSGTENGGYASFLSLLKQTTGQSQPTNGETYMYDAVNIWALGAAIAGTYKYPALEQGILKAANGPGTTCTDYVSCLGLLQAGKSIDYTGAASDVNFDSHHNVYGPFDILHYNSDGSVATDTTLTSTDITKGIVQ